MTKRFPWAGFPTYCPDCDEDIEPGDEVAIVGDIDNRHLCCDPCAEVHDDEEPEV